MFILLEKQNKDMSSFRSNNDWLDVSKITCKMFEKVVIKELFKGFTQMIIQRITIWHVEVLLKTFMKLKTSLLYN